MNRQVVKPGDTVSFRTGIAILANGGSAITCHHTNVGRVDKVGQHTLSVTDEDGQGWIVGLGDFTPGGKDSVPVVSLSRWQRFRLHYEGQWYVGCIKDMKGSDDPRTETIKYLTFVVESVTPSCLPEGRP